MPGGDTYEIYLGSKLLTQQRVWLQKEVPNLALEGDAQLSISYNHCGVIGTSRTITVRDGRDIVLKEWHFPDAADAKKSPMVLSVKEINGVIGSKSTTVSLYYSSKELPAGRMLASMRLGTDEKTAHK